eukprot:3317268-Rhodomonas_salina.2
MAVLQGYYIWPYCARVGRYGPGRLRGRCGGSAASAKGARPAGAPYTRSVQASRSSIHSLCTARVVAAHGSSIPEQSGMCGTEIGEGVTCCT